MSPEMIRNEPHDFKVDIWSLGVLLFELTQGQAPFAGKNDIEKLQLISSKEFTIQFFQELSPEAKDLIGCLIKYESGDRYNFAQIFAHPWLLKWEAEFKIKLSSFVFLPKQKKTVRSKNSSYIEGKGPQKGEPQV